MTLLEDLFTESGLDHDEMVDVVDALAPLAGLVDDAPPPSAALAALFAGASTGGRGWWPRGTRTSAVAGVVVLALSSVGATGLSAAANTLPRPLQHQVSQFSRHYLPFDLPEPRVRTVRARHLPDPRADQVRSPSEEDEASRSQSDRPVPSAAGDRGRGHEGTEPARPTGSFQHDAHPSTAAGNPAHSAAHSAAQPSVAPTGKPASTADSGVASSDHGNADEQGNAGDGQSNGGNGGQGGQGGKGRGKDAHPHGEAGPKEKPGTGPDEGPDQAQGDGAGPGQSNGGDPDDGADGSDGSDGSGGSGGSPTPQVPPVPTLPLPGLPPAPNTSGAGTQVTGG